jgi:hypothetical protein
MPVIGTKRQVYQGTADKTAGGLVKKDLRLTSEGRIVSKVQRLQGRANPWANAVSVARKELGITGFEPVKKGSALYKRAMEIYR